MEVCWPLRHESFDCARPVEEVVDHKLLWKAGTAIFFGFWKGGLWQAMSWPFQNRGPAEAQTNKARPARESHRARDVSVPQVSVPQAIVPQAIVP